MLEWSGWGWNEQNDAHTDTRIHACTHTHIQNSAHLQAGNQIVKHLGLYCHCNKLIIVE